ncbi:MAG: ribose transport system substrate-binding protein [Gaiellaceae bacterium]|nr:ribose transport system substrate-binding protein [Gaiellaceae bacterium]
MNRKRSKARLWLTLLVGSIALLVTACGGSSDEQAADSETTTAAAATRPAADESTVDAVGPTGDAAVHADTLTLTDDDVQALKAKGKSFKVATFWQVQDQQDTNMMRGMRDTWKKYDVPISISQVAIANWDAARQTNQMLTLAQTKPDAMVGILVDQVATASAVKKINTQKIPIVFWDVPAEGADYTSAVSAHGRVAGWKAADAMAEALGEKGEVAALPMKFKFYPTDQRVEGFKERIKTYPNMKLIETKQGATVFDDGQKAGQAILQRYPNIDGIFASWQDPAMGVISGARTLGRTNIVVTTVDLTEPPAVEIARCGILKATVAQQPYEIGAAQAVIVAKTLLGQEVPKFVVTDVPLVTHENLFEIWKRTFRLDPPKKLEGAYQESC